jgi:hypothetical protein
MSSYTGGNQIDTRTHGGDPTPSGPPIAETPDPALAVAFRALHGSRLHGFAILVSLGKTELAEQATSEALAAGAAQASVLRHPERAAAWLRARVFRSLRQTAARGKRVPAPEQQEALAALGTSETVTSGLSGLSLEGRAALVASAIERFEPIDVETILGLSAATTRKVVAASRDRFLKAVLATQPETSGAETPPRGELAARVQAVAEQAMAGARPPR